VSSNKFIHVSVLKLLNYDLFHQLLNVNILKKLFSFIKKFDFKGISAIILYFAVLKLMMHLVFNTGYGYFRDEFYYIACGENLDFGYVDHPPLIALIAKFWTAIFGDSVFSIRILPALAGSATVAITGLMTKELGGGKFALILAGIAAVFSPVLIAQSGYFSMNSFDILFWTAALYILILIIKNDNQKLWIYFGVIAGLGLINKISVLFLGFGLVVGLLLTSNRKYFLSKYLWMGGAIALLMFTPHIIWQIANGWPTLEFIANAQAYKIASLSPLEFMLSHFLEIHPISVILLIAGLIYFLAFEKEKQYRIFPVIYISVLILFLLQSSKPYYLSVLIPLVIALGAAAVDIMIGNKLSTWIKTAFIVIVLPGYLWSVPIVLPVLDVDDYISYAEYFGMKPSTGENHEMGLLPQHFADRFGWNEIVDAVKVAYNQLSDEEKEKALVFGQNYGEAGAIDLLGKKYGLPQAVSGHNSYWLWGYPESSTGEVLIVIGSNKEDNSKFFESVEYVSTASNKYAMPYENNLPVFICRKLKITPDELWARIRHYE
jgi:hypothetical protein